MRNYIPDRGDVVWIDMHPQAGHEQAGRRPAIVLSPSSYNAKVGLALFCPVTNQIKGYPFEVIIPSGLKVTGAILSDQVKFIRIYIYVILSITYKANSDCDLQTR